MSTYQISILITMGRLANTGLYYQLSSLETVSAFLIIGVTFRSLQNHSHHNDMMHKLSVPRDGMRRYIYDIWQPLTLLLVTISFTALFFTKSDPDSFGSGESIYTESYGPFFCNADGKLEETDSGYHPFWDPQLYFTTNVAFGEFPFSSAKVIDAAWDAVVGRGGQFLAAAVAYRTLRRSFTLTMETCTVTIPAAASL
jgi:hypothetical protein